MSVSKTQRTTPRTALAAARSAGLRRSVPESSSRSEMTRYLLVGVAITVVAAAVLLSRKPPAGIESASATAPQKSQPVASTTAVAPTHTPVAAPTPAPAPLPKVQSRPEKPAAAAPVAPISGAEVPAKSAESAAAPTKEFAKKPAKEEPKILFPSVCCSNLNEYVAGAEGQSGKAESIYRLVSTHAEKSDRGWTVSFRVTETIKGKPQPSYRTFDIECSNPQVDYGIDPKDPSGKRYVAFLTVENSFFILTADDYAKIPKS